MTIPSTIELPSFEALASQNTKRRTEAFQNLLEVLERSYEDVAQGINGTIQADFGDASDRWTPILYDTADTTITFTYDHQIGWVFRQGIFTDVWFDIEWTAASDTLTGNMYVQLPYIVANSSEKPFVGVLQPSAITFTAGTECVLNAIKGTYRAEVWNTGSGVTTANQASVTSGQLIGHIRYIGVADE